MYYVFYFFCMRELMFDQLDAQMRLRNSWFDYAEYELHLWHLYISDLY